MTKISNWLLKVLAVFLVLGCALQTMKFLSGIFGIFNILSKYSWQEIDGNKFSYYLGGSVTFPLILALILFFLGRLSWRKSNPQEAKT